MKYDRFALGQKAKELGFVRDTFEKVCRLTDVLTFINQDVSLKGVLALKVGTAINLAIFDLPRLSVDIDLDFMRSTTREEMLKNREIISEHIKNIHDSKWILSRLKIKAMPCTGFIRVW